MPHFGVFLQKSPPKTASFWGIISYNSEMMWGFLGEPGFSYKILPPNYFCTASRKA